MSTNYYLTRDRLPTDPEPELLACMGLDPDGLFRLHIGRSSGGWKFVFRTYPMLDLRSLADWEKYLLKMCVSGRTVQWRVVDDRGADVKVEDLLKLVDRGRLGRHELGVGDWVDPSGTCVISLQLR